MSKTIIKQVLKDFFEIRENGDVEITILEEEDLDLLTDAINDSLERAKK